jgi:hypothetical protein
MMATKFRVLLNCLINTPPKFFILLSALRAIWVAAGESRELTTIIVPNVLNVEEVTGGSPLIDTIRRIVVNARRDSI